MGLCLNWATQNIGKKVIGDAVSTNYGTSTPVRVHSSIPFVGSRVRYWTCLALQDCFSVDLRIDQLLQITVDEQHVPTGFISEHVGTCNAVLFKRRPYSPKEISGSLVRETDCWTQFWSSWTHSARNLVSSFAQSRSAHRIETLNRRRISTKKLHTRGRLTSKLQSEGDRAVGESSTAGERDKDHHSDRSTPQWRNARERGDFLANTMDQLGQIMRLAHHKLLGTEGLQIWLSLCNGNLCFNA